MYWISCFVNKRISQKFITHANNKSKKSTINKVRKSKRKILKREWFRLWLRWLASKCCNLKKRSIDFKYEKNKNYIYFFGNKILFI